MEIEKQVCNPELAKRIKELGVDQDSCFGYDTTGKIRDKEYFNKYSGEFVYHAYSVSELGEILKGFVLPYFNHGTGWQVRQLKNTYHRPSNEADARAILLIFLMENRRIRF